MSDPTFRFYSTEKLGKTRSLTPEGFLLINDTPISRTGTQLYYDGEGIPVRANSRGEIRVVRDASEVFNPIAISSFNGKPITNDHPPVKVDPDNWKEYSIGVILNPRRGDGREFDSDYLYADLLITDKDAIEDVKQGKLELSCGYDSEYEEISPGEGRQHFIIGNHVALVEKGRCGPRCAIGDKAMTTRNQPAWADALQQAFKTQDESKFVDTVAKLAEMMGEVWEGKPHTNAGYSKAPAASRDEGGEDPSGVHVHLHNGKDGDKGDSAVSEVVSRLEALERAVAILAQGDEPDSKAEAKDKKPTKDEKEDEDDKEDDKDDKKKETKDEKEDEDDKEDDDKDDKKKDTKDTRAVTGDSVSLRAAWQEVISRAETLAPGIKFPTFDAKQPAKVTLDSMCKFRRKVLEEALKEDDTKAAILEVNDGAMPKLQAMSCEHVSSIYVGASNTMRQINSRAKTSDTFNMTMNGDDSPSRVVASMNKSNKSFWDKNSHR